MRKSTKLLIVAVIACALVLFFRYGFDSMLDSYTAKLNQEVDDMTK